MPFCFAQCGWLLSEWFSSPEHWQSNPAQEDWACYGIWVRVTLVEGWGDQPPPPHTWTGWLISNMFQDSLEEQITEGVVLAPGEAILSFRWQLLKWQLPLGDVRDVGFHMGNPVIWAGREAQLEMMVSTVQEGHQAIADAVVGKRTKVRGLGHPWGTTRTNWPPTVASNIEEWMWGLEDDVSEAEVRNDKTSNCGTEQKNAHPQHLSRSRRWCRRQGAPQLLRDTSGRSPSSAGGSSD